MEKALSIARTPTRGSYFSIYAIRAYIFLFPSFTIISFCTVRIFLQNAPSRETMNDAFSIKKKWKRHVGKEKNTWQSQREIKEAASFREEKKPYNHKKKKKERWSKVGKKIKVPCRGKSRTVVKRNKRICVTQRKEFHEGRWRKECAGIRRRVKVSRLRKNFIVSN